MSVGYVGWVRCDGRGWQEVCRAADRDACQERLLDWEPPPRTLRVDRMVLIEGKRPETRARQ